MSRIWNLTLKGFLLAAAVAVTLSMTACQGSVYVGVGVAGPYYGPYGPYGPYPYPIGGGVVVGRPIY